MVIVGDLNGLHFEISRRAAAGERHIVRSAVIPMAVGAEDSIGALTYVAKSVHAAIGKGIDDQ